MAVSLTQPATDVRSALNRTAGSLSNYFRDRPAHSTRKIAVVLTTGDEHAGSVLAALAASGVTTIARAFDDQAAALISAMKPDMTVVLWDAADADAASFIAAGVPREDAGLLLMIDAGNSIAGTIACFELGADASLSAGDDDELVAATVNALLRRAPVPEPDLVPTPVLPEPSGGLVLDHDTFEVYEGSELLRLTPTEFRILAHLAAHWDETQSHSQIMAAIHDYQFTKFEAQQSIKVYVRRLRAKLGACASPSVEIVNSRSLGYRLQPTRG